MFPFVFANTYKDSVGEFSVLFRNTRKHSRYVYKRKKEEEKCAQD